jgi:hypothetical protein
MFGQLVWILHDEGGRLPVGIRAWPVFLAACATFRFPFIALESSRAAKIQGVDTCL